MYRKIAEPKIDSQPLLVCRVCIVDAGRCSHSSQRSLTKIQIKPTAR
jgi:hypothetical protein